MIADVKNFSKFYLISNYKEIGEVLTGLLNDRQKNTEVAAAPAVSQAQGGNSVSELKELKELLDAGVITQEEFDAKKKPILGFKVFIKKKGLAMQALFSYTSKSAHTIKEKNCV